MEKKTSIIVPLTSRDFEALEEQIGMDQDTICLTCEGKLETFPRGPFASGIFYKCSDCGEEFQKRNIFDFHTGKGSFRLKKTKGVG